MHRIIVAAGDPLHGSVMLSGRPVRLAFIVWLNFGAAYLLAGLVFSLTYFSTVLVKHAKGLIYGAGVLVGYVFLAGVLPHYWPGIHLPNLVLAGIYPIEQGGHRYFKLPGRFGGNPRRDHPALSRLCAIYIAEDRYRSISATRFNS